MPKRLLFWRAVAGVPLFFAAGPLLFAQDSSENAAEAERVIVTGSHIPTAEEAGPNPVQEIDREQIEKAGERTVAELLRRLPSDGFAGISPVNNAGTPFGGASSIALRGFDASSTLVLLDGRRLAPFPAGAPPTGGVTFVDLNSIPKAALDSIEILKDSASSIYGADAVAGVVNIKFRRDYRGAEVTTSYGNTLDKDSGEYSASVIFGTGDDKTSVIGTLNFYHRNSILGQDRGFTGPFFSRDGSPLNLQLSRDAVLAAGVSPGQIPDAPNFFGHAPFLTNGNSPASDYTYTRRPSSVFDSNQLNGALPESERYGGFFNATRKICGDQVVAYADFFYQNTKTRYDRIPGGTGPFQNPGVIALAIPPHAPGPTVSGPSYSETGVPVGAFNPFNPFQQIISGGTRARLFEFNSNVDKNETDALFSTLGIKGDKLFDGSWGYDAGFRYSQIKNTAAASNISVSRFNRILNAADPIFDPTSSQFIGTTTPFNPFGDYRRPIASNFLLADFAGVVEQALNISKLATFDLNVYTTSLFKLPAGGVGLAFGGQFRRETFGQAPDDLEIAGDSLGGVSGLTTNAGRKTYAFYAEVSVPVVSEANPLPGIRSLEFTAAGRFEDFRNNDTNVLVPKVGMRWQPFDESFTVRATWGEGFHEPSLIELFGSPIQGINTESVQDPVLNMQAGDFSFITRSNPNLQPEDSRSFSGGFVFTPKFVPGLTLTVDLWDIESTSRAFIPDVQNVVDRNAAGQSLPLERVTRDPLTHEITFVEDAFENAGSRKAIGADFGLDYQLQTRIGTFTSDTQVTYLESLQFAETPDTPEQELRAGTFLSNTGALRWKGNSRLDWAWNGFGMDMTAYYLDGFHETLFRNSTGLPFSHWVSQTWMFDVRASYTFNFVPEAVSSSALDGKQAAPATNGSTASYGCSSWKRWLNGTTIVLGCNNVFGQDPPEAAGSVRKYPGFLYDPTGRFVYVSLTKKF